MCRFVAQAFVTDAFNIFNCAKQMQQCCQRKLFEERNESGQSVPTRIALYTRTHFSIQ